MVSKTALTLLEVVMSTVHAFAPEQSLPQPINREPLAGTAVNMTDVPLVYTSEQSLPQLIPAGADVTVPEPLPDLVTVSVRLLEP